MSGTGELSKQNIDGVIAWYEARQEEVAAALPISVSGIKYKNGCLESLTRYVRLWREEDLALNLAICYLYRPVSHFYRAMEKANTTKKQSGSKETENR
jgi:hypothetical protein